MVEIDRVQHRVAHPQTLRFLHAANVLRRWPQFILRHIVPTEKAAEEPAVDCQFPFVASDNHARAVRLFFADPSTDKYATQSADLSQYLFSADWSCNAVTVYGPNSVGSSAFGGLFR